MEKRAADKFIIIEKFPEYSPEAREKLNKGLSILAHIIAEQIIKEQVAAAKAQRSAGDYRNLGVGI